MILALANVKGGVGKTTLAVNTAIARAMAGRDVLLVDADEQGSAADFTQIRTERLGSAGYTAMRLKGREIRSEIAKLRTKFDEVVIDIGGQDSESLRSALTVADRVLVPVQPSTFDVWAFERMATLVADAQTVNEGLKAFAIVNAADSQGRDNQDARDMMSQIDGIETLDLVIVRRKAFRNAASQGRSVLDMTPRDAKAAQEMTALVKLVYGA